MNKRLVVSSAAILAGSLFVWNGLASNKAIAEKDAPAEKARIDLAFCIDTTGSMQSEIDTVKAKTKEIVAKLSGSKPVPHVRVGLVAFRDRGDEYVTKVFPFSDDIDAVVKDISSLKADGGGDGPEAVNQALHAAVSDLKWSSDKKTVKMLFLIGDAEPHFYPGDFKWEEESKKAIARGIQINTIACEGLQSSAQGMQTFQKIAKLADGSCENLTYKQEIVDASGHKSTYISSAGRTYKMAPEASGDSWREGAATLAARGVAAPSPAAAPYYAGAVASSSAGAGKAYLARRSRSMHIMDDRPVVRDFREAPSAAGFSGSAAGAGGSDAYPYGACSGVLSRSESNLADIVLKATKEAAKKKANIDYKN